MCYTFTREEHVFRTALIPIVADQALRQFGAQWYVEEARLSDGRLELQVR